MQDSGNTLPCRACQCMALDVHFFQFIVPGNLLQHSGHCNRPLRITYIHACGRSSNMSDRRLFNCFNWR